LLARRILVPQSTAATTCRLIKPSGTYAGKQGFNYFEGVSTETAGSTGTF
jgi:uncharacterized RmlC-like cupin family protein